jgi:hypothetical protein
VQAKVQVPLVQAGVEFGGFERVQSVQLDPQELTPTGWQVPSGQRRVPPVQGPPPTIRYGTGTGRELRGRRVAPRPRSSITATGMPR